MSCFKSKPPPDYDFNIEPYSVIITERPTRRRIKKHGPLRQAVPCLPYTTALLCCFLNFVIPGTGTMFSGVCVLCCGSYASNNPKCIVMCLLVATGFLQLLLAPLLIGYIWSVMWGILFLQLSRKWWISKLDDRDSCVEHCPCVGC